MYYCCSQIFSWVSKFFCKTAIFVKPVLLCWSEKRIVSALLHNCLVKYICLFTSRITPWEAACDKDSSAPCTASVGSAGYLGQAQMLGRMQLQWLFQSQLPAVQGQQPTWLVQPPPLEQALQSESKRAPVVHRAAFTRCRQSPDLHKAPRVTPGLRSVDF